MLCIRAGRGAFLGRFELHTDDAGIEVCFILLATFLLGCWHPRHAWQWALLVGVWIPAADLVFGPSQTGLPAIAAVVVVIALTGSYAGALLRKGSAVSAGHAG